jgi:hypothetical protein
MMEWEGMP